MDNSTELGPLNSPGNIFTSHGEGNSIGTSSPPHPHSTESTGDNNEFMNPHNIVSSHMPSREGSVFVNRHPPERPVETLEKDDQNRSYLYSPAPTTDCNESVNFVCMQEAAAAGLQTPIVPAASSSISQHTAAESKSVHSTENNNDFVKVFTTSKGSHKGGRLEALRRISNKHKTFIGLTTITPQQRNTNDCINRSINASAPNELSRAGDNGSVTNPGGTKLVHSVPVKQLQPQVSHIVLDTCSLLRVGPLQLACLMRRAVVCLPHGVLHEMDSWNHVAKKYEDEISRKRAFVARRIRTWVHYATKYKASIRLQAMNEVNTAFDKHVQRNDMAILGFAVFLERNEKTLVEFVTDDTYLSLTAAQELKGVVRTTKGLLDYYGC
ncbi:hypothetical protein, conserved [Trypanosoma brucei gambiense DAL972]|uniref:PIN domain-containing protein n=1 Tax=Trypanosoma brucei gambiense (strain MHOM/CI/86/DAL972) TaxID=679716 RepID=C9ZIC2_TRYB9|nr:hypothetical protein, conserved [Trypanosoma brucei gambiense DAL972]CBH08914.1 hypothetical protein, conserved [Trypanosoma brucei gambiense DAL972]|eukprot:XP_011771355.1 hypothetical protein, conserved [Trypanosoma brucei gambiense DAL972]